MSLWRNIINEKLHKDLWSMWLIKNVKNEIYVRLSKNINDYSVGRVDCNILIGDDKAVSRNHAKLSLKGNSLYIKDLGSTYGTFINDIQIIPNIPKELNSGDKILFGNSSFIVEFKIICVCVLGRKNVEECQDIEISSSWKNSCSHLVIDSLNEENLQFIISCLVNGKRIVNNNWLDLMIKEIAKTESLDYQMKVRSFSIPDEEKFTPQNTDDLNLAPDNRRRFILTGFTFLIPQTSTSSSYFRSIIEGCGGNYSEDLKKSDLNKLKNQDQIRVIQTEEGMKIPKGFDNFPAVSVSNIEKCILQINKRLISGIKSTGSDESVSVIETKVEMKAEKSTQVVNNYPQRHVAVSTGKFTKISSVPEDESNNYVPWTVKNNIAKSEFVKQDYEGKDELCPIFNIKEFISNPERIQNVQISEKKNEKSLEITISETQTPKKKSTLKRPRNQTPETNAQESIPSSSTTVQDSIQMRRGLRRKITNKED